MTTAVQKTAHPLAQPTYGKGCCSDVDSKLQLHGNRDVRDLPRS